MRLMRQRKWLLKRQNLHSPIGIYLFHLYSDASDCQLGATLVQNGKPLGFYKRKLNAAQLNYSVREKELLGIVEGMKAFEGMV